MTDKSCMCKRNVSYLGYLRSLHSVINPPFFPCAPEKPNNKIEMLKIHVFSDYCHSTFTSAASYVGGAIVALTVALMVLFYQRNIELMTYYFGLAAMAASFPVILLYIHTRYNKGLRRIDRLIEMMKQGEPIPSIAELIKQKD